MYYFNYNLSYFNQKEAETILIHTIMNHPPLLEATPLDSIFTVSNLMKEGKAGSIIIIDQNTEPVGNNHRKGHCEKSNIRWQRSYDYQSNRYYVQAINNCR